MLCRVCKIELTEINSNLLQQKHRIYICKSCDKVQHDLYRSRNREKFRTRSIQYWKDHPEKKKECAARYRYNYKEKIKTSEKIYYKNNKKYLLINHKKWANNLKEEVLAYYSNKNKPSCKRCGFSDIRALSIDHINGGGRKHFLQIKGGGTRIYQWLRSHNYPEGYQVLCMNCQFIKKLENHENRWKYIDVENGSLRNGILEP